MLATEEVITAFSKVISATTKYIDSPVLLLEANSKYVLNLIIIGIGGAYTFMTICFMYFFFSIYNKIRIVLGYPLVCQANQ